MKRTLATLAAAATLAGCATDNVLLVSLEGDRAFVASTYGAIGITAELRGQDARELRRLRENARDGEELARMLSGRR